LPVLFVLLGVVLAPWIVWLIVSLPSEQIANHWAIAWAGFDVALAVVLVATGVTLARRSPVAEVLAAMAGTFLICDAWFDTMTSRGTTTVVAAILEAVLVELPLAVVCLWIARNFERVLADAAPFLERAGFRFDGRRLVPPESADCGGARVTEESRPATRYAPARDRALRRAAPPSGRDPRSREGSRAPVLGRGDENASGGRRCPGGAARDPQPDRS
jgi:hypothetical protein